MDILDRLLRQEAWATRRLLFRCRELSPEQLMAALEREGDSLHEILSHLVHNIELWIDLLHGQPVRPRPESGEIAETIEGLITRLDGIAADSGLLLQKVIPSSGSHPKISSVETSLAGAIAQVISHNKQHRAMIHRFLIENIPDQLELTSSLSPAILAREA